MTSEVRFSAWGTTVHLLTRSRAALEQLQPLTESILTEIGAACSRFDPDSDLSRVNAHPGVWVEVDPLLVAAIRVALQAAEQTGGLVNPLLGRPLITLGYDADLASLRDLGLPAETPRPHVDAWRGIDVGERAVRIPAGTALDLGSVTKAWTADLIAATHEGEHGTPALINLGGDLCVSAPDDDLWHVDLAPTPTGAVETTVAISSGGVATSSTMARRWRSGGAERHHVLDPRTNLPTVGPWHLVTAAANTATAANTASTAALVLGPQAPAWLEERDVDARLCGAVGVVTTGRWPAESAGRTA